MTEETPPRTLRRILVALDASPHSRAALDAAVRLATGFDAEIEGLFIEDETLLRAAQLPFCKEVRAHTAPPKQLNDRRIQRQLRHQAEYAEHTLQQVAEEAEVPYNFQTVQGDVTRELLQAAAQVDLVVLGKTSTASSRRRLGSTSQTLLSEASSPVLVLRQVVPAQEPIVLYYDGSAPAKSALQLAVQLSRHAEGTPLKILLPDHEDEADRLRDEIRTQYGDTSVPFYVHRLTRAECHRLSAFARQKGGLVILPAGCTPLCGTSLQQFLYEMDRPLLVVH